MKSELQTFDGLDNRKEVMILLERLGSDAARKRFIEGLMSRSRNGFACAPLRVSGPADPVAAYFMLVGVCNELGVSINYAASLLERKVARAGR